MLVSDFMVNSMLRNTQKGISVECMRMHRKKKKYDTFCALWIGAIKSLPVPNCLTLHTSLIDSVLI